MDPPERLPADEALQALDAQGELPEGQGPLVPQAPAPQPGNVLLGGVVRAVDDPQVLSAPALHGGLGKAPPPPQDEVELADMLRSASALAHDLLDLARMNRTDFSVHPTEIDLAEVADDAVRRYLPQADTFGVGLSAVSGGAAPAVADADRVLQVVSNLVENALRLTPAGGEVRVVTKPGLLRVEDTGPGLEAGDHERAFERFYLHERYGRDQRR